MVFWDGTQFTGSSNFTYNPLGTGEVYIAGKLTVDGLIDPIGLILATSDSQTTDLVNLTGAFWTDENA